MARVVFYSHQTIEAALNFDDILFGRSPDQVTPWTITVQRAGADVGRVVGFEGDGQVIIGMHKLKPDAAAQRGCEITVFRMANELLEGKQAAQVFGAFERWLLKRGWRGNLVKKLKFTAEEQVLPIRRFWIDQGFELVPFVDGQWDEHVVKRWR